MPRAPQHRSFDKDGFRESVRKVMGNREAARLCCQDSDSRYSIEGIFDTSYADGLLTKCDRPGWDRDGFVSLSEADRPVIAALLLANGANSTDSVIICYRSLSLLQIVSEDNALWDSLSAYPQLDVKNLFRQVLKDVPKADFQECFPDHVFIGPGQMASRLLGIKECTISALDPVFNIDSSANDLREAVDLVLLHENSFIKGQLANIMLSYAPNFWVLSGHALDRVFCEVEKRLRVIMDKHDIYLDNDDINDLMGVYIARRTAYSPDLSAQFNVQAKHLLGIDLLMLKKMESCLSAKSWFSSVQIEHTFSAYLSMRYVRCRKADAALKEAAERYPEILDLSNANRIRSRSQAWVSTAGSVAGIMSLLEQMYAEDIWHPLTTGTEFARLAGKDTSTRILIDYLSNGTKYRLKQAAEVLEGGKVQISDVIPALSKRSQFLRLNGLVRLSSKEFSAIPKKFRHALVSHSMGI